LYIDKELERIRQKKLKEYMKKTFERNGKTSQEENRPIMDKPLDLSDSTFEDNVRRYSLVVVDCWAPWCAPCNLVAPIIEELARDYAGKILFAKLNVDHNQKIAGQYGIMGIPTILIFRNGKLVDRIVGAMPRQMLEPKIAKYL